MMRKKNLEISERRRNPRINTSSIVGYVLYDEEKNKIGEGKGDTINLSQNGVLIQTENKLEGTFIILLAMDLDGNKIKFGGKIIASRVCKDTGNHLTGIEFLGPEDKKREAIVVFVKDYQKRKHIALENHLTNL